MDERRAFHIAVFENETGFARRLRALLRDDDGPSRLAVVPATDLQELELRRCDLVIIDIDGEPSAPLQFLRRCRELCPRLPAVALVHQGDTSAAVAATKAGAVDCLEKPVDALQLQSVIRTIASDSRAQRQHVCDILTKTEIQVLELILAGKRTHAIAQELHRSKRTIDVHRRNLMQKLGVTCLVDLVRRAFLIGFIPSGISVGLPATDPVQDNKRRYSAAT